MANYQKINTLFKRDSKNIIIPGSVSRPEFEELKDIEWECTEKIDGTNIHVDIEWDGQKILSVSYHGRTENANIPTKLIEYLIAKFPTELFVENLEFKQGEPTVMQIFGEGFGRGIQNKVGSLYNPDGVSFIIFDIRVGDWWLNRATIEDIAKKIDTPVVPLVGYMKLSEAMEYVKHGFDSTVSKLPVQAEGLILKTKSGLLARNGERIITKLKTIDFTNYIEAYGEY